MQLGFSRPKLESLHISREQTVLQLFSNTCVMFYLLTVNSTEQLHLPVKAFLINFKMKIQVYI